MAEADISQSLSSEEAPVVIEKLAISHSLGTNRKSSLR